MARRGWKISLNLPTGGESSKDPKHGLEVSKKVMNDALQLKNWIKQIQIHEPLIDLTYANARNSVVDKLTEDSMIQLFMENT